LTSSVGHTRHDEITIAKLTLNPDHSVGAGHVHIASEHFDDLRAYRSEYVVVIDAQRD